MEKPFKDDKEQLDRLADAQLDIPYYVLKKMEEIGPPEKREKKDRYIASIELFEEKFIERTFAFRFDLRKKGGDRIKRKEVMRCIEGNTHKIFKDMYSTAFGHYVLWNEKKRYFYGYGYTVTPDDCWYRVESRIMNLYPKKIYTFDDCIKLDPRIKYCGYPSVHASSYVILRHFIEYISWYRVMPEIEMYAKNDILHLVSDSRFYNKMKKSEEFAKYVRNNLKYIQNKHPNYPQILKAYRSNERIQIFYNRQEFIKSTGYVGNENILAKKVIDKIVEKYSSIQIYLDYFNAAKHFIYMDTPKALYPDNLKEAHDYYVSMMHAHQDEITTEGFKKAVKEWSWLNWRNKQLAIILAPNIASLSSEGQILHHCVGRMKYDKRMAEGGNLILFIRKIEDPDTPYYTIEFEKENRKVIQCHGEYHLEPTAEINDFLNKWIKKIPYLYKRKKNIEISNSNTTIIQKEGCNQYDLRFNHS